MSTRSPIDIRCGTALLPTTEPAQQPVPTVAFGSEGSVTAVSNAGDPVDLLTSTLLTIGFDLALSTHLVVPSLRRTPLRSRFRLRLDVPGGFDVTDPRLRRVLLHSRNVDPEWLEVVHQQGWVLLVGGTGFGPAVDDQGRSLLDLDELVRVQASGHLVTGVAATSACWASGGLLGSTASSASA